jgi:hypothetical protein
MIMPQPSSDYPAKTATAPTESTSAPTSHSLLLRYWQEEPTSSWRILVHDVASGEQYGFAEVDLLLAFLHQRMGGAEDDS